MSGIDTTAACLELTCEEWWWGEMLVGTKPQLQQLGIGVAALFPGEPAGPARQFTTPDPRGFSTKIQLAYEQPADGPTIYQARIRFPDRDMPKPEAVQFARGVTKTESYDDEYRGTAQALADAGLMRQGNFPGQPGMRKSRVYIAPDGEPWIGKSSGWIPEKFKSPGSKLVERTGRTTYLIRLYVSDEKRAARMNIERERDTLAIAAFNSLPRPARLVTPTKVAKEAALKIAARREWAEGVIKDGPHTEAQFRAMALNGADCYIGLLWTMVFCKGFGTFSLRLDEEDREALADAFEDIREVVRKACVVRDARLTAEIEQFRRASDARADGAFRTFMARAQAN